MSKLLSTEHKPAYIAEVKAVQERQRSEFADRKGARKLLSIAEARKRGQKFNWAEVDIPKPEFLGKRVFSSALPLNSQLSTLNLNEISDFIDWSPFFST